MNGIKDDFIIPGEHLLPINVQPEGMRTGAKIDDSVIRYEVARMLLDDMSYRQIVQNLDTYFNFHTTEHLISKFEKNYFPFYRDLIDRWDKSRHQHLVTRISTEAQEATRNIIKEVDELQSLLEIVDERVGLIRDSNLRSANYEKVLNDFLRTKAQLLERQTRVIGSSGMEERLKEVVKQVALAAQKALLPYLKDENRDAAHDLFVSSIGDILAKLEAGLQ